MAKKAAEENDEQKLGRAFAAHLEKLEEPTKLYLNDFGKRHSVVLVNRDYHHIGDRQIAAVLAQDFLRKSGNSTRFSEQVRWSGVTLHRGTLPYNDFETKHVSPVVTFHEITKPKRVH